MKSPHTRLLASLAIAGLSTVGLSTASAQASKPIIITPPAIKDGSNWSRAPFPAKRQFDDTKAPDAQPIDQVPPNTPATNTEAPVEPARVVVAAPAVAPVAVVTTTEPVLEPTGRTTVVVAQPLEVTTFGPTIRSGTYAAREQTFADIESRMKASETSFSTVKSSMGQMTADGKKAFNAAADEVKEKAKALKKSLKDARNATETNWDAARAQVAADYDAYAAAVARVDTATGVTIR